MASCEKRALVDQVLTVFDDRTEAGHVLAGSLAALRGTDAVVMALPRGGVPVAAQFAQDLGLPLALMLVRKVGFPGQPELALAAVSGDDGETLVINTELAQAARLSPEQVESLAGAAREELRRRRALWGQTVSPDVKGRIVVLVDDGMATGARMEAAVLALRALRPRHIVVAVPVAAVSAVKRISAQGCEVACPLRPARFRAVGSHYVRFAQVEDAEVRDLLDQSRSSGTKSDQQHS